jgi:hypothetical protein
VKRDAAADDPPVYTDPGARPVQPKEFVEQLEKRYSTATEKERCVKNLLTHLQGTFKTIYTSKLKANTASGDAGQGTMTPDEARS